MFGREDEEEQDVSEKVGAGEMIGLDGTGLDGSGGDDARMSSDVRGNPKGRLGLQIPPLALHRAAGTRAGLEGECISK